MFGGENIIQLLSTINFFLRYTAFDPAPSSTASAGGSTLARHAKLFGCVVPRSKFPPFCCFCGLFWGRSDKPTTHFRAHPADTGAVTLKFLPQARSTAELEQVLGPHAGTEHRATHGVRRAVYADGVAMNLRPDHTALHLADPRTHPPTLNSRSDHPGLNHPVPDHRLGIYDDDIECVAAALDNALDNQLAGISDASLWMPTVTPNAMFDPSAFEY